MGQGGRSANVQSPFSTFLNPSTLFSKGSIHGNEANFWQDSLGIFKDPSGESIHSALSSYIFN